MNRRTFNRLIGLSAIAGAVSNTGIADTGAVAETRKTASGSTTMTKPEQPFKIGMLIFNNMTNLDFVGPCDMLSRVREAEVTILGKTLEPVLTDSGCLVIPKMTLKDAPQFDMLFVGGGPGTTALMEDEEVIGFFKKQAPGAKWITAVCTGTLVLGAAGLFKGYKAATHWTVMDLLPILGATPVYERVVIDRNRISGGGVTAGIDFALTVIAELWGTERAQLIQLGNEYNPQPPFNSGSPFTAPKAIVDKYNSLTKGMTTRRKEAAERMAKMLG
ncbi:DJ-1/PfpI family protein [Kordiimonas pumila]|uniref:DJ-1/PfpI family protein n=1 Tax=Kordiimonas pumila TaxID=2161677 RepID=A0ABV7D6E4_9PROT|nr:DJ-1/PfpI family protein [Kordiimonas pumila]